MDINHLLLDLEVIKQLLENDKLAVITLPGSTKLSVHSVNSISSLTRWYNNYNREDCINYLEQLTTNIVKTSDFIISGQHSEEGETIRNAIDAALNGLTNLRTTYVKDSVITAKLTLIINKFKIMSNIGPISKKINII